MKKDNKSKRLVIFTACFILFVSLPIFSAKAQQVTVLDPTAVATLKLIVQALGIDTTKDEADRAKQTAMDKLKETLKETFVQAWYATLKTTLNNIAYDTATWIGSGGEGQKPMFIRESWQTYLGHIGDQAAGQFIESIGQGWGFNLCEPSFDVKLSIMLGLKAEREGNPRCTWTEMSQNWENEYERVKMMKDKDWLKKLSNMFEPTSNDFGIALNLHAGLFEIEAKKTDEAKTERLANGSWLDLRDIGGNLIGVPDYAANEAKVLKEPFKNAMVVSSLSPVKDAINVFTNQIAISFIDQQLKKLGSQSSGSSGYTGDYGLGDMGYESGPSVPGVQGVGDIFNKLNKPDFTVNTAYDVLAELSVCPNPDKPGPTSCVIDCSGSGQSKFTQAIIDEKTVGEAMREGYLVGNWKFGFNSPGDEPACSEGYPYRSMIILRKFRILPVGWELAAQRINDNPGETGGAKNLEDLVNCFDPNDDYGTAADTESWCRGLVDPNWVLKAPLNFCRRQGPGPEILNADADDEKGVNITRAEYCADDQTCIKENDDGSCKAYGYCVEEKRKWEFNSDSCNSLYNTCQAFTSRAGSRVAYLENTLDYSTCNEGNVGCKGYCLDYDYLNEEFTCGGGSGDNLIYLDKDVEECDSDSDGCHEFIRSKTGLGTNLIDNSNFEEDIPGTTVNLGAGTYDLIGRWPIKAGSGATNFDIIGTQFHSSSKSLHVVGSTGGGVYSLDWSEPAESVLPENFFLNAGFFYTVSAWVNVVSGGVDIAIGDSTVPYTNWLNVATSTQTGTWERISVTVTDVLASHDMFVIQANQAGSEFYIDDVQFEVGETATSYKDYRDVNLVYEKLLPEYLEDTCYMSPGNDYRYIDSDGDGSADEPICDEYARRCNADEVGCDMYISETDSISVPAKVLPSDYCPSVCVGYDEYLAMETYFDSLRPAYFIPSTARKCSAASVGCEEFTNLDSVNEGGEEREYYSYIRQCVKPDSVGANCGEFYTWEGSSETGFQLKVHSMRQVLINDLDGDGDLDEEPEVTENDSSLCSYDIYNLPVTDPAYNPDCREFYNRTGETSYHLFSLTVTCSSDCHPFRMAYNNVIERANCVTYCDGDASCLASCGSLNNCADAAAENQEHCILDNGVDNIANTADDRVVFCKNGGYWNRQHSACLYNTIPNQGIKCGAAQSGCHEYSGADGNRMYTLFTDNFEGSTQNWTGLGGTATVNDNMSLRVGEESLYVSGGAHSIGKTVGSAVQEGKSYYLDFVAKNDGASQFNSIYLTNGTESSFFNIESSLTLFLSSDWRIYRLNLANLNHTVDFDTEELVLTADGDFFIDNVRLVEITDRYFLIRDSWQTPAACYNDVSGSPVGVTGNLGCDVYRDRDDTVYYLQNFSYLCQESAVGCNLMIDTQNYQDESGVIFNGICELGTSCASAGGCDCYLSVGGPRVCGVNPGEDRCYFAEAQEITSDDIAGFSAPAVDSVIVSPDKFVYAVYDSSKSCLEADKGCSFMGVPYNYGANTFYTPVYLKSDADEYENIICRESEDSCESWNSSEGTSYFKDPGDMVCEWRSGNDVGGTEGWYRAKIDRCDSGIGSASINGSIDAIANSPIENQICFNSEDCAAVETSLSCVTNVTCSGVNSVCVDRDTSAGTIRECGCNDASDCNDGDPDVNLYSCIDHVCHFNCITDENDYSCPVDNVGLPKTIGTGGLGNAVIQPRRDGFDNWVGLCPNSESGCTEYIDPISEPNINILFNPDFYDIDGDGSAGDGWNGNRQNLSLEPKTLYVFAIKGNNTATINISGGIFYELNYDNNLTNLVAPDTPTSISLTADTSRRFFVSATDEVSGSIMVGNTNSGSEIILKEAIVDYQLQDSIKANLGECNLEVNYEKGCVLFNERSISGGYGPKTLDRDADDSPDGTGTWQTCDNNPDCDSNELIKVKPDRTCDKWLACRSLIKDKDGKNNICFDVGLCDSLDENNDCNNFLVSQKQDQVYAIGGQAAFGNSSGYVKVGYDNFSPEAYYPVSSMSQEGEMVKFSNGGFEFYTDDGYPNGWRWTGLGVVSGSGGTCALGLINSDPEAPTQDDLNNLIAVWNYLNTTYFTDGTTIWFWDWNTSDWTNSVLANEINGEFAPSVAEQHNLTAVWTDGNITTFITSTSHYYRVDHNTGDWLAPVDGDNTLNRWNYPIIPNDGLNENAPNTFNIRARINSAYTTSGGGLMIMTDDSWYLYDWGAGVWRTPQEVRTDLTDRTLASAWASDTNHPLDTALMQAAWNRAEGLFIPVKSESGGMPFLYQHDGYRFTGQNAYNLLGYTIGTVCGGVGSNTITETPWDPSFFKVIDNYTEAQNEGTGLCYQEDKDGNCMMYNPEGYGFLRLGSEYTTESEFINVNSGVNYVITGYVNTINLQSGTAVLQVSQYDETGGFVRSDVLFSVENGRHWTFQLGRFGTTLNTTAKIKITLLVNTTDRGDVYFDDIKIRPALNSRLDAASGRDWYEPQTCRLYPESDALSCEYYDDNGARNQGWWGYCLENDHDPGSEDACLMWYPVDKVKGEGIEEGEGYEGRSLVYYCTAARRVFTFSGNWADFFQIARWPNSGFCGYGFNVYGNDTIIADMNTREISCDGDSVDLNVYPPNTTWLNTGNVYHCGEDPCPSQHRVTFPSGLPTPLFTYDGTDWYDYDEVEAVFAPYFGEYRLCRDGCVDYTIGWPEYMAEQYVCEQMSKTVTLEGNNKYWSARVFDGSTYTENCNSLIGGRTVFSPTAATTTVMSGPCVYGSDYTPFGSLIPPNADSLDLAANPERWEQMPIFYDYPDTSQSSNLSSPYQARLGQLYEWTDLRNLFAESYGTWQFDFNTFDWGAITADWYPPNIPCSNQTNRAASADQYCGIVPLVNDIRVNNSTANNVVINSSGFINLEFNSYVDSQQLPLVMYGVDWGDNTNTIVSGIEMRDRRNIDDPHAVYHLYGYWDLRSKNNRNQVNNSVYCGNAGSNTATNFTGATITVTTAPTANWCAVRPLVQIKDNWGWCSRDAFRGQCTNWTAFGDNTGATTDGWVIVLE